MTKFKNQRVHAIEINAAAKMADLAGRYVHAAPEEKEAIQAGLDVERWLAESCRECLDQPEMLG